jgi:hypothetical protein
MSETENATRHHSSIQEERETEKLRRLHGDLAIGGPAVFGLRDEFHRDGCLWVPGKDRQGFSWVPGATGNDLVALAPDAATKERLMGLCAASNERYEELQAGTDFVPDPELEGARRQFAINRKYLRAWAHSAGFRQPEERESGAGHLRVEEMHMLHAELESLRRGERLHFEQTLPEEIDDVWLRKRKSSLGEAGALDQGRWQKALKNHLFCAWTAEFLITLHQAYMPAEQLVRLSNNWSVVQLYYVAHHFVQALRVAAGQSVLDSHAEVHKAFRLQWQLTEGGGAGTLSEGLLRSWLASYRPAKGTGQHQFHVGREALDLGPQAISHLAPFDPLDATYLLGECLKSTCGQAIQYQPKAQRDAHKGMYTMLDYLYKFRCRRNYGDNISFVRGPMRAEESREVQDDFIYLAGASALLYETRLMGLSHPQTREPLREEVQKWMRQWLEMNAQGLEMTIPLKERLRSLSGDAAGPPPAA